MEMAVEMKPKKSVAEEMADLFHHFSDPKDSGSKEKLIAPSRFRIWDLSQKYFFLENKTLVAVPKGSNSPEELLGVVPNRGIKDTNANIFPIIMGPQDGKRVLSCAGSGGQPQIKIEEEDIMNLYGKNEPLKNFTFLNHTGDGQQTCSFESAAFPGWFLSTSTEPNKPISLSQKGGAEITTFYFEKSK
ncbi:interleukin-36 receptor antagonist protein [Anolis carolinensis]|uniref:interleukin-36 receptor antagonist protein n=1 Tax=Anolis carolinensis TaxID=28377 RepID=UPI0004626683|nr:PREDICTED: interleukin-36 receptor antagonist protein [Anolis carolinensis]|eukprot:XP_008114233.1 PREDICTED: interleukin-36 receptor antagonist protein [Anolis carolinensis]